MTTIKFRTATSAFGLLGAFAFAHAPAFAQAETESVEDAPIVVTAQRREEAQVDVPISVTTLGAEQLATSNVQELSDIVKLTPGLRFDNAGAFFQPTIRGIGSVSSEAIDTASPERPVSICSQPIAKTSSMSIRFLSAFSHIWNRSPETIFACRKFVNV